MLIAYGTLTLSADTIAMLRLVLGERDRFPEIAATFFEVAVRRTSDAWQAGCENNASVG